MEEYCAKKMSIRRIAGILICLMLLPLVSCAKIHQNSVQIQTIVPIATPFETIEVETPTDAAIDSVVPLPTTTPTLSTSPTESPLSTAAVTTDEPKPRKGCFEQSVSYYSRGVLVPATICVPDGLGKCPLVVLMHGFAGNRDQGGGFKLLAEELYRIGIASIRMDFAGCGKSEEDFSNCSLSSMKRDVVNACKFMIENYDADKEKIGLVGYSFGGRVLLELLAERLVKPNAVMLIAPAAHASVFIRIVGGQPSWDALRSQAEAAGYAECKQLGVSLGKSFFTDFDKYDTPEQYAAENYAGDALMVYCKNDAVVPTSVTVSVVEALSCETIVFEDGGHPCGLYPDKNKQNSDSLTEASIVFFGKALADN